MECGEVLDAACELVQERYESRAEFQVIPKLSSFGRDLSYASTALVDSVCNQCEKIAGVHFSPELKQRVMVLVEAYRRSLEKRHLHSYENIVRTAIIIVLRNAGYQVPAAKIVPRFDEKKAPVFRLLSRISQTLNIHTGPVNVQVLIYHATDCIMTDLREGADYTPSPESESLSSTHALAGRLMELLVEIGIFPPTPKLSQAIACCYFAIRYGSLTGVRLSIRACIRANDFMDSEKCVYRDYELLRGFVTDGLALLGVRNADEALFIEKLDAITDLMRKKQEVSKRLRLISDEPAVVTSTDLD